MKPSVPIPRILPAISCLGRIAERSTSTTLEDFSSIAPVAIQTPYPNSCPYSTRIAASATAAFRPGSDRRATARSRRRDAGPGCLGSCPRRPRHRSSALSMRGASPRPGRPGRGSPTRPGGPAGWPCPRASSRSPTSTASTSPSRSAPSAAPSSGMRVTPTSMPARSPTAAAVSAVARSPTTPSANVPAARERPHEDEDGQHGHRDRGGDGNPCRAAGPRSPGRRPATSRGPSAPGRRSRRDHLPEQLGERRSHGLKWRTSPTDRARSSTRCSSAPSVSSSTTPSERPPRAAARDRLVPAGRRARPRRGRSRRARDARSSAIAPSADAPSDDRRDRGRRCAPRARAGG